MARDPPHKILCLFLPTCLFFQIKTSSPLKASSSIVTPTIKTKCPDKSISDDVAVVLRTGATESQEKLPIHFQNSSEVHSGFDHLLRIQRNDSRISNT
ncbi:hypothetical protein F5Y16DRAFT_73744 [Xylariaceae sp. FL0255]|nr:hypothetical protein F5Y16DRAFT_73744 [Xylariaceae sp. FL0255]